MDEARRLESLWSGDFGDAYAERNRAAYAGRAAFWRRFLDTYRPASTLEVGCNLGGNLRYFADRPVGIDINHGALAAMRADFPNILAARAAARALPFADGTFDLVFTAGVLIHQPPAILPAVVTEIARCARRLVLCAEYYAPEPTEISYRGQSGALFKRDFGALYRDLGLRQIDTGFLSRADGWDDVTWWVFAT